METSAREKGSGIGRGRACFEWIRKNVIDPETRLAPVTWLYCIAAMTALLSHVAVTLYFPRIYNITNKFPIPMALFALGSILMGRLWKDKGFWIFMALLVLKFIRNTVEPGSFFDGIPFAGFYCIGGVYAVGRVLTGETRRKFLAAFCALWTLGMTVLACLSIHVAWTGDRIMNLVNNSIYIRDGRISAFYAPVQAGVLASASMAVAIIGFFTTRNRVLKVLFPVGVVMQLLFSLLTGSRISHIMNAFILSTLVCVLISCRLKKPAKALRALILCGVWMLLLVLFFYANRYVIGLFNDVKARGGLLVSIAYADGTAPIVIREVQFGGGLEGLFGDRVEIWESVFQVLKEHPDLLLWGGSTSNPFGIVMEYRSALGKRFETHTHNTWLHILLENGIPGLLLYLCFNVYTLFHGFRLMIRRELPVWQRLLLCPVAACLIGDLIDITCLYDTVHPQVTVLFLFAGMAAAVSGERRKEG